MRKYGKGASEEIREEVRAFKKGKLNKKRVTSRKQAIAIGLSKARKKGIRVPKPKK